jgi:hypothetical protein
MQASEVSSRPDASGSGPKNIKYNSSVCKSNHNRLSINILL